MRFLGSLLSTVFLSSALGGIARAEPPVSAPAVEAARPVVLPRPTAIVHVDGPLGIVLEASASEDDWRIACEGTCDMPLALKDTYRIKGEGVRASKPFRLEAAPDQHVVITVDRVTSSAGFTGGVTLVALAPAVGLTGFAFWIAGACAPPGGCDPGTPNKGEETAGIAIGVAAGAVLVGGIVLLAVNAPRTRAQQRIVEVLSPAPRRQTSWVRSPLWREPASSVRMPSPVGIPVFSGTF